MGVAERFYEAFMVRDHYTMGLLYANHATFRDPVFPRLTAQGVRLMWQMLLSEAEDLEVSVNILEDTADHAKVDWTARYTFTPTKRVVVNKVHTEMVIAAGKIVQQVDDFSFWRWSGQALGWKGWLLGPTPLVRDKVRAKAAKSLKEFAQFVALTSRDGK
ncbi:MAG TPA: nuclear transport factor 2 family protein [Burkholderiaceae bacterium]|nr:nuclear transport factor 2 family protein [Burkholderiaceae bacterium]HQR69299.1 nuclear transport factor 2 family protein [Burkholderiaceae bacterium]